MSVNVGLEKCFSFINYQLQPSGKGSYVGEGAPRWFVTISRDAGCGAHVMGEKLATLLQASEPEGQAPWTVFDRNLVEKVLEDHHLPKRFEKYMPEDRVTEIADAMEELFDLHPSAWALVHKASETMLRVAQLGRCILIGRAANIITGNLECGFHVRLIGSLEKRVEGMTQFEGLKRAAAVKRVKREDRARRRYVKKYFHEDIANPMLYHLVINTDFFSCDETAQVIATALLNHTRKR